MKKKGVELSMNVIIIAAIGLLVLVILAVLVINAGGRTQAGMKSCNLQGGICQAPGSCTGDVLDPSTAPCSDTTKECCKTFVATGQ